MLDQTTDYTVTSVLWSGRDLLYTLVRQPVDLLVLDIDLPDVSGFDLAQTVRRLYPTLPILALSMLSDTHSMDRMLTAGATGYCIKSADYDELLTALRTVSAGQTYLPATYFEQRHASRNALDSSGLSEREADVVRLIAGGASGKQIADRLCISPRTVETHRKNIYRKLGVHTNIELTRVARQNCLL